MENVMHPYMKKFSGKHGLVVKSMYSNVIPFQDINALFLPCTFSTFLDPSHDEGIA